MLQRMTKKSDAGSGHTKSPTHSARLWLRSLFRPLSRAGTRFWISFLAACVIVYSIEALFERFVESEEIPDLVQRIFHLTGFYQSFVEQVHFPYPRYTAVVLIDPRREPEIPDNHHLCDQRKLVADLVRRVQAASPAVIVVDKYFGTTQRCARETDDLRNALDSVTRDTVVVIGRRVDLTDAPVSTKDGDRYFLTPSVNFGIQNPRLQEAVVNIDPDTRKIPLRFEVYESREQAEKSTGTQWRNSLALQASLAHPWRLLQRNRRIASFIQHNKNPFASFLKEDDFEPILAGRILCGEAPANTVEACPSGPLAENLRQQLAGRVVLIGEIDPDLDTHPTVVGQMSGVLLQANFVEALLDDRVFRPVPSLDYIFGFLILMGLELSLIWLRGRVLVFLAFFGLGALSFFIIYLFAQLSNVYLDPVAVGTIPVVTKVLSAFFGRAEKVAEKHNRPSRRK